jgi:uncharacterized membrane protein
MELWQILGWLHPKLVSFPIVLLLAGLLFDLIGHARREAWAHRAGKVLTIAGTVSLLFAFICGIYAEVWAGRAGIPQHPIELHELMANIASWGFVVLMAWRLFLDNAGRRAMTTYLVIGLLYFPLLGLTAYLGGKLVFEYGAAVTVPGATPTLTIDDLNTLATRQTDANLNFSEWMHHIFGWMTLGLGVSLFIQATSKRGEKIRWIAPLLFLCGGVFLFLRADADLYPSFFDLHQFRDREVQLHKTISIIMIVAGIVGLWRKKPAEERSDEAAGENGTLPYRAGGSVDEGRNGRMVAAMAVIGGGLLFTHVHTVAPYANVAAGVYIAHMVLGFVALGIGGARLAQDYWPQYRKSLGLGFAALMCVESVLLITYNEGLPWYIGYGTYNRWGSHISVLAPHGGTVAPYGPLRAELVIDPHTGDVDVWTLDRYSNRPVPVSLISGTIQDPFRPNPGINLLVPIGYEQTAVRLQPVVDDSLTTWHVPNPHAVDFTEASHFHGHADFLKSLAMCAPQLALPIGERMVMGYFDPWVAPQIVPVPENEIATYQCPMHDGVQSQAAGKCPLCGMEMIKIDRTIRQTLHDSPYSIVWQQQPVHRSQHLDVDLRFAIRKNDHPFDQFALTHGKLLHLIVVSSDLAFFDHVHPQLTKQSDGSSAFELHYAFPKGGRYLLFADCTPAGDREQVFKTAIDVWPSDPIGIAVGLKALGVTSKSALDPQWLNEKEQWDDAHITAHPTGEIIDAASAADADAHLSLGELFKDETPISFTDAARLIPSPAAAMELDGNHVALLTQPRSLVAGVHTQLIFTLEQDGRPVNDLEPYMGAMGHCVGISEDTQSYIHSHPEDVYPVTADSRGGPTVAFHTLFPRPGKYKIWGQFQRGEKLIVADFVVDVKRSWIPPTVLNALLNEN